MDIYLSDDITFLVLQAVVLGVTLSLICLDKFHRYRAGRGPISMTITRGADSMARFYAMYATTNGLLVALILSVETAKDYKVLLTIVNTLCCFYVFVLNHYMRNKILGVTEGLRKVEER